MTLAEAVKVALAAYDEDDGEREAILAALVPVVLGDRELFRRSIVAAWEEGVSPGPDEIRETLAEYQRQRAEIDAQLYAELDANGDT